MGAAYEVISSHIENPMSLGAKLLRYGRARWVFVGGTVIVATIILMFVVLVPDSKPANEWAFYVLILLPPYLVAALGSWIGQPADQAHSPLYRAGRLIFISGLLILVIAVFQLDYCLRIKNASMLGAYLVGGMIWPFQCLLAAFSLLIGVAGRRTMGEA
jgi:hypothetical protein